ncbi:TonB-dependent siderophore receptor [Halarcobacter mediterraneus]|uniref:TonB-dependent siderophore receptor n=1 Tax=Halarcobacter mediterraneus TaxID=2023153 RepID=A0A4Q1AZR6_9BACT|nr:TonB-dependent siderophore receptor [Halarcobacter mediterraneus]RXK14510.1 TonB-dependent siderophore receptor [Halarcobacter mediterraneus]
MNYGKKALVASSLVLAFSMNLFADEVYTIKDKTLKEALEIISKKSNLSYIANDELLEFEKINNIENIEGTQKALDKLLQGTGLKAIIKNEAIVIVKSEVKNSSKNGNDLGTFDIISRSTKTDNTSSYTLGETSTATKLNMSLKETPQSISIMSRQRIEDQGLDGMIQLLEQTPGINVQSQGNSRFKIYSRGGYQISSYQLDGIPTYSDTGTQTVSQALSDTVIYDHIEVLRGAAGLMTGSGEPSGTINMVRKKPTTEFQGNVEVTAGSWDLYRINADVSSSLNDSGSIRARMVAAYQKNKSFVDYLEEEKKVLYGIVEADISDNTLVNIGLDYQEYNPIGHSSVGSLLFYDDLSRTDFDRSNSQAIKWGYDNKDTYNIFTTVNHYFNNDWKLKASINHLNTDREFNFGESAGSLFDKDTGDSVRIWGAKGTTEQSQTGLHLTLDGTYQLFGREHELVVGYNYSKYQNEHIPGKDISGVDGSLINYYTWGNNTPRTVTDGALYKSNKDITQSGTYLASRIHPNDDLSLIFGGRFSKYEIKEKWDWTELTQYNSDKTFKENAFTPYVGLVYDLNNEHTIYTSYSTIFQPQDYRDKNGQSLDPLESINYEIGYKNELFNGALNSSIALYQIDQTDLAVVDAENTIIGTTDAAYKSIDGAKTKGIDIEVVGEIIPNLNAQMSYTYAKTDDENGKQINTVFPEHMIKIWTTYKINKLTLGGGINWQNKIFFDTASLMTAGSNVYAEQESYYVVNLMSKYEMNKNLELSVNINNLFDKKYYDSLDEQFLAGSYGAPRNFTFSLKYKF